MLSMECATIDTTLIRVLEGQVETLTTSGKPHLDEGVMKDLKRILRQADEYVQHCFHLLLPLMEKDHSEIRLSAFQIIDQVFTRSHTFRELVVDNFQHLMELALETDLESPLPPPKIAAKQLKRETMRAVHTWHEKFSSIYKRLALGYNYLKNCKKIDFIGMQVRSVAERRRAEEEDSRKALMEREKINTAITEISEMKAEMKACITQAENCLLLLLPEPETFSIHGLHRQRSIISSKGSQRKTRRKSSTISSRSSLTVDIKTELLIDNQSTDTTNQAKIHEQVAQVTSHESQSQCTDIGELNDLGSFQVKCEYCKIKGCSSNCESSLANTTIKPNGSDSRLPLDKQSASSSHTQCHLSVSSEGCSKPSNSLNSSHNLKRSSNLIKSPPDSTTEMRNVKAQESEIKQEMKQEATAVNNTSDSDDFQEISSGDESESSGDESGDELSEFDDSDLEDILVAMSGIRDHGVTSQSFAVGVELANDMIEVEETADNEDILKSLNDTIQLIQHRYLPAVHRWIQVFTKCGDETQIKLCLDTKGILNKVLNKVSKLKIKKGSVSKPGVKNEESSESEGEFEEVASKDGYEADIPEHLKLQHLVDKATKSSASTRKEWKPYDEHAGATADPTSSVDHRSPVKGKSNTRRIASKNACASTSSANNSEAHEDTIETHRRDALLKQAPTLPYNTDLHYWGEEIEQPLLVNYSSEHRWWTPNNVDDTVDKDALAAMTSRLIDYTGEFKPVSHQCRAPVQGGKLCPRMDRYKCPFHGRIVPRDSVGNPVRPEDRVEIEKKEKAKEVPAWEDVELQREIEAATGKTLQRKKKKGSRKKKEAEYPNLTNTKARVSSGRARLESKIFSPKVLKRVAERLDILDAKRVRDKFGNQFHYALTNRR